MAVGLQVWADGGGVTGPLIIDTSDSLATILGYQVATSGFTVTDANFAKGVFWYLYYPSGVYPLGSSDPIPAVSFNAGTNTMTVTGSGFSGTFIYGFY